ncbi:MAG: phosphotransferase [Chloroflexi bacterium]|nr:phosphotransferase [Chloroflexota bacterium]
MAPAPCFHDHFIVPHVGSYSGAARLLLVEQAGAWTLPGWAHPARLGHTARELDDPFWPAAMQQAVLRRLGLAVSVLHADLYDERDPSTGDRRTVIVLENRSPEWSPRQGTRWVSREEFNRIALPPELPRASVLAWFDEAEAVTDRAAHRRPPWQRPGWFEEAVSWSAEQLQHRGLAPRGAAEQLGTKVGRYLMRIPTASGAAYFKALPAMYDRELSLLALLATEFPSHVPELLASDTNRRWHLTRDHAGTPLGQIVDIVRWEHALEELGRIQVAYIGRATELLAAGCIDLRPETMAIQITTLIGDVTGELTEQIHSLSPDEIHALEALVPDLKAACELLAAVAVPSSLVHGDFIPDNVAVVGDSPIFTDWCESALSHPFFSVVRFMVSARWGDRWVRDDRQVYARLRGAYLKSWERIAPMSDLVTIFELAAALQPLAYALTYWHLLNEQIADGQSIVNWERKDLPTISLRRLLDQRIRLSYVLSL